jgi:hypothetical protein
MTYCLGKAEQRPLQQRRLTLQNRRSETLCAPSAIRTRGLLLRSNPAADAVAICNDAGQVRGGAYCCSPSYLVIANRDSGGTIATGDAVWIASKVWLLTSLSSLANQALPAAPKAAAAQPTTSTHVSGGPGGFLRDLVPVRMSVHAAHSGSAPCPP